MGVFGRAVLSDGFHMLKVPARCSRRLLLQNRNYTHNPANECNRLWLLKNSRFAPNRQNWGDRKCLPNPRRSIVGLPDAILFLRISRGGGFQQPHAITLRTPPRPG